MNERRIKNEKMPWKFLVPEEGTLTPNGDSDPIIYYYKPIIKNMYIGRIQTGLDLLKPHYERVMEFGYGSGILFPTLDGVCDEFYGLDIDSVPEIIQKNISGLGLKHKPILSQKDLIAEEYPDNYFDLVLAFSIFEHIKEPDKLLAELNRIIKPGGQLLVGMPRVDKFMKQLFKLIGFNKIDDHHVARHQDFVVNARKYFELVNRQHFPRLVPRFSGLYFNMLFKKNDRNSN